MSGLVQILTYSDDLLLLRWHKQGQVDDEEQLWTPGRALRSGRCSFSGAKIICGEPVFSPRGQSAYGRMILASALESVYRPLIRPRVQILEYSGATLLVRWVEPGRTHYGEQIWRLARAARPGVCALSGSKIVPGYEIFKPTGRPVPSNAKAMILATVLRMS
ncbi:DUF3331 domain-containing protein [Burkholderia sp. FL-7-2-10-S1-D7]|uniref:DUF3331 domain-containing protein n=1 Tax=Burkholderia sp. FL-7-2-10-S1-D7 TaxID=1637866 RepID=UPI0009ECC031|nr:DUF3331 domain-containing protein [Burkholderia sp. FL-7-2-10-S1-D7]